MRKEVYEHPIIWAIALLIYCCFHVSCYTVPKPLPKNEYIDTPIKTDTVRTAVRTVHEIYYVNSPYMYRPYYDYPYLYNPIIQYDDYYGVTFGFTPQQRVVQQYHQSAKETLHNIEVAKVTWLLKQEEARAKREPKNREAPKLDRK